MAEIFLFSITEGVLAKIFSLALQELTTSWNIKPEVRKLQDSLTTIKAVILDADEQQSKNHEVRDWLEKLKDAVYDIDDLLDDLSSPQIPSEGLNLKKVRRFFSCLNPIFNRPKIAQKVRGLRQRLDEIAADRQKFHFTEKPNLIPIENRVREETHSFVIASEIIGRDNDKESIIQLVLNFADEEHVSVIPVVGIGGLGKTTVIKLVYNDVRVIQSFDLGMWISVSEDFSVRRVLGKILKSATGENLGHLDMDEMQRNLCDVLKNKKYLLVLDDVWNEDRNKWMELQDLLTNCRPGSKIIVTTRSKAVGNITGTMPLYNLSGLSDDDGLSLFLKCAFRGENDSSPNLVQIGKEIVKKCSGVPLAVKTLGSLLYMNTEEKEWLRIKESDIWEIDQKETDVLPLLRLSYDQLPSHLKQCFSYCSILPSGIEIPREVFINLWIAQGYIHQSANGSNRNLEDIGNEYFNELLSRFCFQEVITAFDGEILACKIHNLVHNLAQSVATPECLNVKSDVRSISNRVRHLYFNTSLDEFPKALLNLTKLRSFRCACSVRKTSIQTMVLRFRRVKVLILNSLDLKELPSSIADLTKLKYLDLSFCSYLKSLPNSICKLVNLQTLSLINCQSLQDLPRNFVSLISIRTLYLTCQEMSLVKTAPLKSFNSLQFLLLYNCDFVEIPTEGFQHFTSLRVLHIYECARLSYLPKSIEGLAKLEKLWIWNCEELDLSEGAELEGLKSLRSLLLMGLPKLINLPVGLLKNVSNTLKFLRIANCVNFTNLPEWLQSFDLLQSLFVEGCPEFCLFPDILEGRIAKVHITDCPKLAAG